MCGCFGYESSPWGATQKANPGFRIQAKDPRAPNTPIIDIGCTSDMGATAKKFNIEKDGLKVETEDLNLSSNATNPRNADTNQLLATAYINRVIGDTITATISAIVPAILGGMSKGTGSTAGGISWNPQTGAVGYTGPSGPTGYAVQPYVPTSQPGMPAPPPFVSTPVSSPDQAAVNAAILKALESISNRLPTPASQPTSAPTTTRATQ
jgi:hypothetical protein